jgi:ABC-type Fe3+/spermidine/putrescine transport system ATPase subunit
MSEGLGAPSVRASGVVVDYGASRALDGVDLTVGAGETLALLGPSGSGKTTLLYAIAGFLDLVDGRIELAGRLVSTRGTSVPPERRPVGMVFQHYGLWPHMNALETVSYPLRRAGLGASEARRGAGELLEQLRVGHLSGRRPAELSGGEQQRVGLARALARRPAVYLLDEPTAHLDGALKAELQSELAGRLRADGAAAVHATHDVEEALAVADRVALLRAGRIVQVGTPEEVYARPVDEWAATLTGPASFIVADVLRGPSLPDGGDALGTVGPPRSTGEGAGPDPGAGGRSAGRLLVRPDWLRFDGPLEARVLEVRYRGTHTDYRLAIDGSELLLREPGQPCHAPGDAVSCRIERIWRMPEVR